MKKTNWHVLCPILLFMFTAVHLIGQTNSTSSAAGRTITIESAHTMEYLKQTGDSSQILKEDDDPDDVTPEQISETSERTSDTKTEIIKFTGSVVIVVKEGQSESRIEADEIIYDKSRDTLSARGSVVYEHKSGQTTGESFSGEALYFDIKKRQGVFLGGAVRHNPGRKDSDPYIVRAAVAGRDSSSTVAFRNGILSTCDDDDPHWSIRASRIWLLPGNEIALLNGVLSVGPVPLFWFPFFYYPSDEMIFNPVFGYKNREGYFVQTTTYLYGRKPLATQSGSGTSFSNFLQSDTLKEQRREGLFYRNLENDASGITQDYFKIMADAYSSLGAMAGIDGSWTFKGIVRKVNLSSYIGVSRVLYPPSMGIFWTPYDPDGEETWVDSRLFDRTVPFRYRFSLAAEMDRTPFNMRISFPLISDPWFRTDFLDRKETMNWFQLLTEQEKLASEKTVSEETTYSWSVSGSINPRIPALAPWVQSIRIGGISGLLTFNSKLDNTLDPLARLYDPRRRFFYPDILRGEVKPVFSGTLLSSASSTVPASTKKDPDHLVSPWPDTTGQEVSNSAGEDLTDESEDTEDVSLSLADSWFIPSLDSSQIKSVPESSLQYSVLWNFSPVFTQELRYYTKAWETFDDIYWRDYASVYRNLRGSLNLTGKINYGNGFLVSESELNLTGQWQDHPLLSEEAYSEEDQERITLKNLKESSFTLTGTESISISPFTNSEFFKPVGGKWSLSGKLMQSDFIGTIEEKEWIYRRIHWEDKYITTHEATAILGVSLANHNQTLTIGSSLPPKLESYTGNLSLAWPFGSLKSETKLYQKSTIENKWLWDPLSTTVNWTLPYDFSLSQSHQYDLLKDKPNNFNMSLDRKGFSASIDYLRTQPYRLEPGAGWVADGDTARFLLSSASVAYTNSANPLILSLWLNRFKLEGSFNTNLNMNLIRLTDSSFNFTPRLTLKIHEFLDLSFSSHSQNNVIARYFQDVLDLPAPLPGEDNVFIDLMNSFKLWDNDARRESAFKLKSLDFSLTHFLHDWTMQFTYSVRPVLKTDAAKYYYEFSPDISFSVLWKPISDIKTVVKAKEGSFVLNPPE